MSLLSASDITNLRSVLEITLTHTYTRTVLATGTEDDWGDADAIPGGTTTSLPCRFETSQRAIRNESGVTIVNVPTLTVSATDTLGQGDKITAVTDQLGSVLLAGPLIVDRLFDDAPGLGASLLKTWELRSVQATR